MAKIKCPGCAAEIDTETGKATFPAGDPVDDATGAAEEEEVQEEVQPPPAPQPPARKSRFIR